MKYSVIGATGQAGGATARALLKAHHEVRAVVRSQAAAQAWIARGAEAALADLTDADALCAAFTGVDAAFVMTPPYLDVPDPAGANREAIGALRAAILAAGVPYVVYLSSIGAQHDYGLGAIASKHELEAAFLRMPIPSVAIRAGWFMENYKGRIASARVTGTLPSMLDSLDLAVPMIAGRSVEAVVIPREQRAEVYRSWGLSPRGAGLMSDMIDGFNSAWISFEGANAEPAYGTTSLRRRRTCLPTTRW
jgi:NAD(P)H dehydrogenase (quinone)